MDISILIFKRDDGNIEVIQELYLLQSPRTARERSILGNEPPCYSALDVCYILLYNYLISLVELCFSEPAQVARSIGVLSKLD